MKDGRRRKEGVQGRQCKGVDLMAGKEKVTATTAICRACAKLGFTALYVNVYCPSACVLIQESLL
jgi:hypothetical protein